MYRLSYRITRNFKIVLYLPLKPYQVYPLAAGKGTDTKINLKNKHHGKITN